MKGNEDVLSTSFEELCKKLRNLQKSPTFFILEEKDLLDSLPNGLIIKKENPIANK